jgi:RAD3-like DEAD/DEAH box helicase
MLTFSTLSLAPAWLDNLTQLGYVEMTPIQALALPAMLERRDVLGQAATGTAKTAAFGLALLARITPLQCSAWRARAVPDARARRAGGGGGAAARASSPAHAGAHAERRELGAERERRSSTAPT